MDIPTWLNFRLGKTIEHCIPNANPSSFNYTNSGENAGWILPKIAPSSTRRQNICLCGGQTELTTPVTNKSRWRRVSNLCLLTTSRIQFERYSFQMDSHAVLIQCCIFSLWHSSIRSECQYIPNALRAFALQQNIIYLHICIRTFVVFKYN